jgi:hypothetical protein
MIEAGYGRRLKTGAIFVDLSAAYGTVCRVWLMVKLARIIHVVLEIAQ